MKCPYCDGTGCLVISGGRTVIAQRVRRSEIMRLQAQGVPIIKIAEMLHVSRQYLYELLQNERDVHWTDHFTVRTANALKSHYSTKKAFINDYLTKGERIEDWIMGIGKTGRYEILDWLATQGE